ncbi:MAG: hypothetical protein R3199_10550, partial [Gemmatimonadota bacterium]|nr:hypothetical protein [Gemmatimonadota bacterium]
HVRGGWFVPADTQPADSVVDLAGAWVVPPFGEAHTHALGGSGAERAARQYLRDGIFYALSLNNAASRARKARERFSHPTTLDPGYAHGGFTSTGSHPYRVYEMIALGIFGADDPYAEAERREEEIRASRLAEGDAYWFVDSVADLEAKWPAFLEDDPDVVKVYLSDVATGLAAEDVRGHGLHPGVLRTLVARAHARGLRVFAHVDTVDDFRIALEAGVDAMAHLPGQNLGEDLLMEPLTEEDLARAALRGTVVVPTTQRVTVFADSTEMPALQAFQRDALRRLHAAGVTIALGEDWFGRTSRAEAEYIADLGVFDNATLLRIWSVATPRTVFPTRRIGRLEPGWEASFLALGCDPIEEFACTGDIRLRYKQGRELRIEEPAEGR